MAPDKFDAIRFFIPIQGRNDTFFFCIIMAPSICTKQLVTITPDRRQERLPQPPLKQPADDVEEPGDAKVESFFCTFPEPQAGQVGLMSVPDFWSFSKWELHSVQLYSNIGMIDLVFNFTAFSPALRHPVICPSSRVTFR